MPDYCNNTATAVKSVKKRSSPDANVPKLEVPDANTESDTKASKKALKSDSQVRFAIVAKKQTYCLLFSDSG